jgi:hypothetical protein
MSSPTAQEASRMKSANQNCELNLNHDPRPGSMLPPRVASFSETS